MNWAKPGIEVVRQAIEVYLFRADTHDRLIRPAPASREYKAFCELMETNQMLAEQIEAEWARRGIATFKQYLRRDLAQRVRESD